jgi:Flp pilus assembly protein TadD
MSASVSIRATVVCLAVTLVSGCAAHERRFSSAFIKPGVPTVTIESASPKPSASELSDYIRKLRTLQSKVTTKSTLLPTLEGSNRALSSALLRLSIEESAENHRLVAAAYRAAGVSDFAYRHLQRALRLSPCDSNAYEGLAQIWRDWGVPGAALGDAHHAVYCRPGSASAQNTLGTVLEALGQRESARVAFGRALQLDPSATFALNNLCYLALAEGDSPSAQKTCEQALSQEPTMAAARTNLAMAYAMEGDIPRAEARLADGADVATGQYNIGILRMSVGHYREAEQAFKMAATERPSLAEAARRAAQARALAARQEP